MFKITAVNTQKPQNAYHSNRQSYDDGTHESSNKSFVVNLPKQPVHPERYATYHRHMGNIHGTYESNTSNSHRVTALDRKKTAHKTT